MAICDALLSVWCIATYAPSVLNLNLQFFDDDDAHDEAMNELSFDSLLRGDNIPCFLLTLLGQFSSIGSAAWYLSISYCLWRVLFGRNPFTLSANAKRARDASPASNPRNLRFTKRRHTDNATEQKSPFNIAPVREDEATHFHAAKQRSKTHSVLPTPLSRVPTYQNSSSSLWSNWSSFTSTFSEKGTESMTFNQQHQR